MELENGVELDLELAVTDGIDRLDAFYPEWPNEIDIDTLDMANGSRCIIGQLFGDYLDGITTLGLDFFSEDDITHGFNLPHNEDGGVRLASEWRELTDLWIAEIREIRASIRGE